MRTTQLLPLLAAIVACGAKARAPALPVSAAAPSAEITIKRNFISLSRPSGTDVATIQPDGTLSIAFDVLENGRGPHVDATIKLAANGTIVSLEAKGHHAMGTPVAETFSRQGQRARWKSNEEWGDKEAPPAAFFVPMAPIPDAVGLLAEALLKTADGVLPLLPAGEAHIAKFAETTVRPAAGESRHLIGYAVTGLDLVPTYLWMDDGGKWFGTVDAWSSLLPEGFEGAAQGLLDKQNDSDKARDIELATRTAHRPSPHGLALTHARVLDVARGRWLADQTVVVMGDRIQSVGSSPTSKIPAGAEVVDLAGKALLPGLWDMHVHLGTPDGVLDIASGVTSVRDVGNDPDKLDDYKKRFDEGSAVGPHVYRFGFVEGRGAKAASSKITAETPDEAKAAVEFYRKRGYDGIKIYNSVKPELIPIIAGEAHARGLRVTGHIPVHVLAEEAVRAGYDGIEHINMLFLNFFATHDTDTRDTTRFTLVGDKAASLDLESKPVRDFIALLREKKTVIDPTLDAFEDLLVGKQGHITPGLETMVARLPVQTQRWFLVGGVPHEGKDDLYRQSYDKCLAMVKTLADAKVTVVTGTDALAGLMLHHELALFVRGGIKPADALRMATLDPARVMNRGKDEGSIEKGKIADLFIVEGDPLARIEDVGRVVSTVKDGVVYPSAPLYASVGVRAAGN